MIGYVLASLIFLGGTVTAMTGELVNEEIRGWLDYLPRFILRLAARRLDPAGKITIYEDEWLPELTCILRGAEARPISRLIIGVKFSVGLLITARRIARHLHRTSPDLAQPSPRPVITASAAQISISLVAQREFLRGLVGKILARRTVLFDAVSLAKASLESAERVVAERVVAGGAGTVSPLVMLAMRDRDTCRARLRALDEELRTTEQELRDLTVTREQAHLCQPAPDQHPGGQARHQEDGPGQVTHHGDQPSGMNRQRSN